MVAHSGRYTDEFYVSELVADALDDTFMGVLRWDPAKCPLEKHLRGAIKSRSRHDYHHAKDHRHARLDADDGSHATLRAAESALGDDADERKRLADITDHVLEELERLAGDDREVVQLVSVFGTRVWKKVDVMCETGWSSKLYEAVRKRLIRLVKHLPTDVREALLGRA